MHCFVSVEVMASRFMPLPCFFACDGPELNEIGFSPALESQGLISDTEKMLCFVFVQVMAGKQMLLACFYASGGPGLNEIGSSPALESQVLFQTQRRCFVLFLYRLWLANRCFWHAFMPVVDLDLVG